MNTEVKVFVERKKTKESSAGGGVRGQAEEGKKEGRKR